LQKLLCGSGCALALLLASPAPAAESGPTFHATLGAASEAAAEDGSLVLLIFGAEWCPPCKLLKETTLASSEFREQAGPLRVVESDVDADPATARSFKVSAIPDLVLLTADGKVVGRELGFKHTSDLLMWINEGRRRAKAGEWEGTAPASGLAELANKGAAGLLDTNEFQRLIAMLGEPDPADRAGAARILLGQREQAVEPLIEALNDPYLGVRIGAAEILARLAPGQVDVDPWQSPADLAGTITRLKEWWKQTGKLPAVPVVTADPASEGSIKSALERLRADDPIQRTEAMTTLTQHGPAALPLVREAIRRSERAGDHRAVAFLEDVRWAILVPDSVERRAGGVRSALARGRSPERQAAAGRLAQAGKEALPVLTELVNDSDGFVVESAVRALSSIGGKDAIPAMAALLQAADSNLRMTAAQALGRTKNAEAIPWLVTACDDPNEVVACAALAAIEEIRSARSAPAATLMEELGPTLKAAMKDPRWRVRATAVEVAGKLSMRGLGSDLKALLDDADGFVVKNVLSALERIGMTPDATRLAAIGRRLPALRADIVQLMLENETDETVRVITDLFNASALDEQAALLSVLARHSAAGTRPDDPWKPLLTRATTAADVRLRRAAAEILLGRSPKLAAEMVGPLLADEDAGTRVLAAKAVINIINADEGRGRSSMGRIVVSASETGGTRNTNNAVATPERMAEWHAALRLRIEAVPDLEVAAAVFATGDPKTNLPLLLVSLETTNSRALQRTDGNALGLVLAKLPWPEGEAVLERICRSPRVFGMALNVAGRQTAPWAEFLFDPARFRSVMETAADDEVIAALQLMISYYSGSGSSWSLVSGDARSVAIAREVVTSARPALRAVGAYVLGRDSAFTNMATPEGLLGDADPWVRAMAVGAFARKTKDRDVLEARLGPMLADTNAHVAMAAATALLEPEVRESANLEGVLDYFRFRGLHGGSSISIGSSDERPLSVLPTTPVYLEIARSVIEKRGVQAAESAPLILLLAQHGDFTGLDRLLETHAGADSAMDSVLVTGIALSRDVKYLPAVRRLMESRSDEWELRELLKALRGMTGAEARQVRLEINKRMRVASAGGTLID